METQTPRLLWHKNSGIWKNLDLSWRSNAISVSLWQLSDNRKEVLTVMQANIIASTVDHGTSSISKAYASLLSSERIHYLPDGIKRGGPKPLLSAVRKLYQWEKQHKSTLCLFNTPTLLGAYLPKLSGDMRRVAILDWTANCPYDPDKPPKMLHDSIYRHAFKRLHSVASPSKEFIKFYSTEKHPIVKIDYPLPYPEIEPRPKTMTGKVGVLFIGADYKRKGGDLLLDLWMKRQPRDAHLSFVCPKPPQAPTCKSVSFLKNIQSGTNGHRKLFEQNQILILPSKAEPYGYVLLEAINFGLIPITPMSTGASDVVKRAGGIVSQTPTEAIEAAFNLMEQTAELEQRSAKICAFTQGYNDICLAKLESLFT